MSSTLMGTFLLFHFFINTSHLKEKINFVNFHLIFIRKFTKIAFIFLLCVVLKIGNSRKVPTNVLDIAVASYSSDSRSWRRWHQVINFFILKFVTEIYYLWVAVPSLFIQFLMNSCSCYFYLAVTIIMPSILNIFFFNLYIKS